MKIAILRRDWGISHHVYQKNVSEQLHRFGVKFHYFTIKENVPDGCNLIWTQGAPVLDTYRIIRKTKIPIITTIHGAEQFYIPLRQFTSGYGGFIRWTIKRPIQKLFWRSINNKISRIITVSKYCKKTLQEHYLIRSRNIQYIYHGYDRRLFNEKVLPYNHSRQYLLHVSNGKPKKNVTRIIKAFQNLNRKDLDLLIIAPFYNQQVSSNSQVIFLNPANRFVSQETIARLYRGAVSFVFPSIDETFGLPIIEAMACGCPVISSNSSACLEIAGDSAILVDPFRVDQITEAMKIITAQNDIRNSLVEKARNNITRFSWKDSGNKHLQIFRNAAKG